MSNPINTISNLTGKDKSITTEVMLTEDRMLRISTYNNFGGKLVTTACGLHRLTGKNCEHMFGTRIPGDYNRRLAENKVRQTAKAVQEQHSIFLARLEDIKADCQHYYGVSIVKVDA